MYTLVAFWVHSEIRRRRSWREGQLRLSTEWRGQKFMVVMTGRTPGWTFSREGGLV